MGLLEYTQHSQYEVFCCSVCPCGLGLAAPAADADAQIIAGGVLGHGLLGYGHGLVNGVYASGPAVAAAAPVAVAHAAPVAVAAAAPVAVAHAAPVAVAHAAP